MFCDDLCSCGIFRQLLNLKFILDRLQPWVVNKLSLIISKFVLKDFSENIFCADMKSIQI